MVTISIQNLHQEGGTMFAYLKEPTSETMFHNKLLVYDYMITLMAN